MTGATGCVYTGLHEFLDMSFVLHALRSEDWFIDVGANIGSYTILAGGATSAQVVAFEPIPETFRHLCRNVRVNDLGERVKGVNAGLGQRKDSLLFTTNQDTKNHVVAGSRNSESNSKQRLGVADGVTEVPVVTLDGNMPDVGDAPLIVKIDVEGWETQVLNGATAILQRSAPTALIVELNGSGARYGFDEEELHRRLVSAGFDPMVYAPFDRLLSPLSSYKPVGNTLYVNAPDFFTSRVQTSPPFNVMGTSL
jgi:FkbM family methyltransferase